MIIETTVSKAAWDLTGLLTPSYAAPPSAEGGVDNIRHMWNTAHGPKDRAELALLIDQHMRKTDYGETFNIKIELPDEGGSHDPRPPIEDDPQEDETP